MLRENEPWCQRDQDATDYDVYQRAMEFLQTKAARVSLESGEVSGGRINAVVLVENLPGHKLPTAYPARRAWLHFVV